MALTGSWGIYQSICFTGCSLGARRLPCSSLKQCLCRLCQAELPARKLWHLWHPSHGAHIVSRPGSAWTSPPSRDPVSAAPGRAFSTLPARDQHLPQPACKLQRFEVQKDTTLALAYTQPQPWHGGLRAWSTRCEVGAATLIQHWAGFLLMMFEAESVNNINMNGRGSVPGLLEGPTEDRTMDSHPCFLQPRSCCSRHCSTPLARPAAGSSVAPGRAWAQATARGPASPWHGVLGELDGEDNRQFYDKFIT